MKMFTRVLFAATALASLPSAALAQSNYFGLRAGVSSLREAGLEATNPRVTAVTGVTASSNGSNFSLALGRAYANRWRAEVEFIDRRTAKYTINTRGATFSGINELRVKSWALMANGYYDIPVAAAVTAYVGGGLGYAYNSASGSQTYQDPAFTGPHLFGTTFPTGKTGNFAWSLGFGGSYAVNPTVSLDLGYRFTDLGRYATAIDTVNGDERFRARLSSHDLLAGLRFKF